MRASRDLKAMTWTGFQELFMSKYFPETARHAKDQEFLELKQGAMTEYENFQCILIFSFHFQKTRFVLEFG